MSYEFINDLRSYSCPSTNTGQSLVLKKISNIVQCSTSTVKMWLRRRKSDKALSDKSKPGRSCMTTEAQEKLIAEAANNVDEIEKIYI